ncbi:hypothetical protein [Ruegeria sp. EL01]|jgi:hypothetical protein|uniref:hypothetical protein n=1 Tax=Ruegeria sp. EL01 TaxID=2107578 RepID=UPI000EA831A0|nr:hypothetical protein [Ruegeria sp. EL01]
MRSYQAARTYFSLLEFICWGVIAIGALIAIIRVSAVGQMSRNFGGPPMAGITALIPGFMIMFGGLFCLVMVQIGRAGVDTAEYTQQNLKVARDHLEISKQALSQGRTVDQGFAGLTKAQGSEATHESAVGFGSTQSSHTSERSPQKPPAAKDQAVPQPSDEAFEYKGKRIALENGQFIFGRSSFRTIEAAQRYIDQLGVNPNADANKTGHS